MGGMTSLLNKYLKQYVIYMTVIMLCSSPLFIFIFQMFYIRHLDGLLVSTGDDFIENRLPDFTFHENDIWNKYDEHIKVLLYDSTYILNRAITEPLCKPDKKQEHPYRVIYRKIEIKGKPHILMCRVPMMETNIFLKVFIIQLLLILAILFIASIVGHRHLAKKLWSPFYKSLKKIEHYNLEQGEIPVFEKSDIQEFSNLNMILSNLISNNLQIYKQQKEFIENASHELQTPIAVFQSKLDVVIQNPHLSEEQINNLRTLYGILSRLARLNKNLLLLAKMDNNQFKDLHTVDFIEFLKKSLYYFKDQTQAQGIRKISKINPPLTIKANESLLESLVNNLMANAILHNISEGGTITIEVVNNTFSVSNTGKAQALDTNKIFKRFSRTTEEKRGNGLGLSIVYQICKFHKWELEYQYTEEQLGIHTFIVKFQ